MHWSLASMTSLGYGDSPVPRTTAEYIFSMWTQVWVRVRVRVRVRANVRVS